jgi:REP element-mobilizing transposase RayT
MRRASRQLDLALPSPPKRGGKRKGAGRKPRPGAMRSPHVTRPEVTRHTPVHVSLKIEKAVGRIRNARGYAAIRRAIAVCMAREDFAIVHASVQGNHLHLLVEADNKRALANGVRAFMISATRGINRWRRRKGRVFAARYHSTSIDTPRQARNCLAYVLNNWRRHREDAAGAAQQRANVDPYSSAILFDGWKEFEGRFVIPDGYDPLPVRGPRSWLLRVGWRKHYPRIGVREVPGPLAH